MGLGALRNAIRPLARTVLARRMLHFPAISGTPAAPTTKFRWVFGSPQQLAPWVLVPSGFHSLTDTRFPKRRPSDKPRRKRASLRPPGPYAWVQYTPGEPIPVSRPNEGSVKGRNQKKRMRLRRAFILSEAKKRKAQLQEAKRKKNIKKIERKMAAVARERAWAQRLAELQKLEEEKKRTMD
ncbi:PREDICTED: uncharacterized protein LOC104610556 [Nelumbo nucifera]|uniref:Uncharacterized protein LOC104610556 n=1 Tax=Nelumbo nucifera TaxID=4432 RepID=A0A1U8B7H4_NELNU|nr:PREDICTED: uncharacterized protein LOC104610556 [Nelumbo nucifera]